MKAICTTTIYAPSKATLAFAEIAKNEGWTLIIAGDNKTPHEAYRDLERVNKSVVYLDLIRQQEMAPKLSDAIGWNSIQRRNLSFVHAWDIGAEVIASVDDDNIPHEGWGRDLLLGKDVEHTQCETPNEAFDPLSPTNHANLWHRGFPIQLLADRQNVSGQRDVGTFQIQADFWDGDPDVDAICRMQYRPTCVFNPLCFPFASNKPAPFNSQNTFLLREVLPHYFMQVGVGRADDIWAAFHAQAQGFKVIFSKPSVTQERNLQDSMKNFEGELLNYRYNLEICRDIPHYKNAVINRLSENSRVAFELYQDRLK